MTTQPNSNGIHGLNGTGGKGTMNSLGGLTTTAVDHGVRGEVRPSMDWLPRLRDRWGNRMAWGFAYAIGTLSDVPIDETALAPALKRIEQEMPLMAAEIRDFHDRKYLEARRRYESVIAYENDKLEQDAEAALAHNLEVEAERAQWEQKRDKAVAPHVADLRKVEDDLLTDAHADAAAKVARAGGSYAPENPAQDAVLRRERRPLEAIAAELRLPWSPGDLKEIRGSVMGWLSLIGVGILLGISLGLVVHLFSPYSMVSRWPLALACAALGITLAYALKQAIRGAWRHVGQNYYARQSRRKWAVSLGSAVVRTLVLLAVEVCVERQGLLGIMQLNQASVALSSGHAELSFADQLTSWVMPLIVSTALLVWAGDQGYLEGRHHEVLCRLRERQDEIWRNEDLERRADPAVQAALDALARVRYLLQRRSELEQRVAQVSAPFDARIAEVLERKTPVPAELCVEAKHRIQDSRDDMVGAQADFNKLWEQARWELEPSGSSWSRFWRRFFGFRQPRRVSRERLLK